jgi:hypothetical protein
MTMKTPSQSEFEVEMLLANEQAADLPVAEQLANMRRDLRLLQHGFLAVVRTLEGLLSALQQDHNMRVHAEKLHRQAARSHAADAGEPEPAA